MMTEFNYVKKLCNNKLNLAKENNDLLSIVKCERLLLHFNDIMFFTKINLSLSLDILLFIGVPSDRILDIYLCLIDYKKIFNVNSN